MTRPATLIRIRPRPAPRRRRPAAASVIFTKTPRWFMHHTGRYRFKPGDIVLVKGGQARLLGKRGVVHHIKPDGGVCIQPKRIAVSPKSLRLMRPS